MDEKPNIAETDKEEQAEVKKEPLELEKGDLLAIFIAAAIVFTPLVLGFGVIVLLLWLFLF